MARGQEEEAAFSPPQLLQLAESHLRLRNFSLSRQYALESHHPSDPDRHRNHLHAAQIIAVADIISAASSAPHSAPTNWYAVLQLDTFCDDFNLIKSQFKKLLSLLGPAKGRLTLASEAMNLVSKAFKLLCDSTQKAQLDSELAVLLSNQKHRGSSGSGNGEGEGSFWTFCPYCFYIYQYDRVYEGCCLRCQNETCRRPFHGISMCSLPRMELEKGHYFGCFGYFPLGFDPCDGDGEKFESWSPLVGVFPVKRAGKSSAGRVDDNNDNDDAQSVEILDDDDDDSDQSEAMQHGNVNEHLGENPRRRMKKSVAWNARKLMGKGRSNEGGNDQYGGDETYGGFGGVHDVGVGGSGVNLDADEDVKFFEEDGEIFVGLGPDDDNGGAF